MAMSTLARRTIEFVNQTNGGNNPEASQPVSETSFQARSSLVWCPKHPCQKLNELDDGGHLPGYFWQVGLQDCSAGQNVPLQNRLLQSVRETFKIQILQILIHTKTMQNCEKHAFILFYLKYTNHNIADLPLGQEATFNYNVTCNVINIYLCYIHQCVQL